MRTAGCALVARQTLLPLLCTLTVAVAADAGGLTGWATAASSSSSMPEPAPSAGGSLGDVACNASDLRYMFTPCNATSGMMQSIQYFARECVASDLLLSSPRTTPCVMDCMSGTFYDPETLSCAACGGGTFSLGQGDRFEDLATLPHTVGTYCFPEPCSAWGVSNLSANTGVIDSGNQSIGQRGVSFWGAPDETVVSTLTLVATIVSDSGGFLRFSYRVESEKRFDGLFLSVNGSMVRNPNPDVGYRSFFATGYHRHWYSAKIPLPFGRSVVAWIYAKDANQRSSAGNLSGTDRAFLRDIELEGTRKFASSCSPCVAGKFADRSGSSACYMCPANTFSAAGATSCTPCGEGETAPPGSAACVPKPSCQASDYVATYTACSTTPSGEMRERGWKLINTECVETDLTAEKKRKEFVPCSSCMRGMYRSTGRGPCKKCPGAQYFDAREAACKECASGSVPVYTVDFKDGFDAFGGTIDPQYFQMTCEGQCAGCPPGMSVCRTDGSGFELASYPNEDEDFTIVGIRQSMSHGNYFDATLSYNFTAESYGSIILKYMFIRDSDDAGAIGDGTNGFVYLDDGSYTPLDRYYVGPALRGEVKMNFAPGNHTVWLSVIKDSGRGTASKVSIVLLSLVVVGDARGGAASCAACPPGSYCPPEATRPLLCPRGTSQRDSGKVSCTPCEGDSVSLVEGSKRCNHCSYGTIPNADRSFCQNTCNVTIAGNIFDFTSVEGVLYGPLYEPGVQERHKGLTRSEADAQDLHRLYVSPCSSMRAFALDADDCLVADTPGLHGTHGCIRVNEQKAINLGGEVSYQLTPRGQLRMLTTGGEACTPDGYTQRANLTFVCEPSRESGELQYIGEDPRCTHNFLFTSKDSCPACTESSFRRVESECTTDNVRRVEYFRKELSAFCIGGFEPPKPVNLSCLLCQVSYYEPVWSDCVGGQQNLTYVLLPQYTGCVDNGKLQFPDVEKTRKCSKIEAKLGANLFTSILLVFVTFVGILALTIHRLCRSNRELMAEYQRLSQNTGELADMDPDEVDVFANGEAAVPSVQVNSSMRGRGVMGSLFGRLRRGPSDAPQSARVDQFHVTDDDEDLFRTAALPSASGRPASPGE